MKKIGIISLFGYNNYGNRLQLFAVQKVYKALGFDSEIIKFQQKSPKDPFTIRIKVLIHYLLNFRSNRSIANLKKQRITNFKKHAHSNYTESKNYLDPLKINEKFHENYSFLSVGSDQIWGWFTHSISNLIFLKFAPKEKRLTFSPSFGSSKIEEKYKDTFTKGLLGFENISVREESGAEIVKKFTKKEATVLCDPTMCLSKSDWLEFSKVHEEKPNKKFILTYFLGVKSAKVEQVLINFSKEYEIIELNSCRSPKFYVISPSEFVDYINSASLFLTDSFHGVVFSIILKTPFAVFSRIGGESMQTRISNILEKFSLQNRFEMKLDDSSLFDMDFKNSEDIIIAEKLMVFDFLKKSLNISKK